jgi:predicted porin
MKKSLLALAVLGAFAGAASAQSTVTLYGRVDPSIGKDSGTKFKYLQNGSGSRFGVRGVEDLGGGLKALFNLEHRFDADTGASSSASRFWTARSIVGLEGGFGQIVIGREYTTAFLQSQLAADPWGWDTVAASATGVAITGAEYTSALVASGATAAQAAAILAANGLTATSVVGLGGTVGLTGLGIAKVRNDSSVTYKFSASGFTAGFQIAESTDAINKWQKKPVNFALSYAGGPLSVAMGYEKTGREFGGVKEKITSFNGAYDLGSFKLGGFIGRGDSAITGAKHKSWMLTATAPVGQGEFRAAYGRLKADDIKVNNMFAAGYHYSLSKRTTIYGDIVNNSGNVREEIGLSAQTSKTGWDLGLKHNF